MQVFISWSGNQSRSVADALYRWLPLALHYVTPWLSSADIAAGDRWAVEVGKRLEKSNFGILCITRENLAAPWILFEAGAISKSLSASCVVPLLFGVDYSDLTGPLTQFQAKKCDNKSTLELVESINSRSDEPIESQKINELHDALWPKLEGLIKLVPEIQGESKPARPVSDILEDLTVSVRRLETRIAGLEEIVSAMFHTSRFSSSECSGGDIGETEPITVNVEPLTGQKASWSRKTQSSMTVQSFLNNLFNDLVTAGAKLPAFTYGYTWVLENSNGMPIRDIGSFWANRHNHPGDYRKLAQAGLDPGSHLRAVFVAGTAGFAEQANAEAEDADAV